MAHPELHRRQRQPRPDLHLRRLGRLTLTGDNGSGSCLSRRYQFNANSNRTTRITYGAGSDGKCQAITPQATQTSTYDAADRLLPAGTHAGLVYDAYGRLTTVPAVDLTAGTGNLTATYYTNDLVRSLSQDGATLTYGLDGAGRLKTWTNNAGVVKTNHFGDASSDSPDWISETTDHTQWTRNITDLGGNLAAITTHTGTTTWQTVNLHGDVTATTTGTGTEPSANHSTDEYGVPASASPARYGWLGGKQRSSEAFGGVVLMGVRLYAPQLGRFLQTDPVPGGNANAYTYPLDPANEYDLDGKKRRKRCRGWAWKCWWRGYKTRRFMTWRYGNYTDSRILGRGAWAYARLRGGRCKYRQGMRVCRMKRGYPRGGLQVGETFLTGWNSWQVSSSYLRHEKKHRKQWRRYGWRFAWRYARAGGSPCRNRYEREAGWKDGKYLWC